MILLDENFEFHAKFSINNMKTYIISLCVGIVDKSLDILQVVLSQTHVQ